MGSLALVPPSAPSAGDGPNVELFGRKNFATSIRAHDNSKAND